MATKSSVPASTRSLQGQDKWPGAGMLESAQALPPNMTPQAVLHSI